MKQLFLHIGHGKTGTSSVQALLARSHDKLRRNGILYPAHPSFGWAQKGHISSGNIAAHDRTLDWMQSRVLPVLRGEPAYSKYIFSSEQMFMNMAPLFNYVNQFPAEIDIRVVLCVRNPLELAASSYMQGVKRHGFTRSFDDVTEASGFTCGYIKRILDLLSEFDKRGIRYSLLNYSVLGPSICRAIATEMGILEVVRDELDGLGVVNRSLTRDEAQLVMFVNAIFGQQAGSSVSDKLVNLLPWIKGELPSLSPRAYEQFHSNVSPELSEINERLPLGSQLSIDRPLPADASWRVFQLSEVQAGICKEALFDFFKRNYVPDATARSRSSPQDDCLRDQIDHARLVKLKAKNRRLREKLKNLRVCSPRPSALSLLHHSIIRLMTIRRGE